MHPAMDVGVVLVIVVDNGIDHHFRLLRGGGIVEIDQWLSMHLLVQDRKLPPDRLNVKNCRYTTLLRLRKRTGDRFCVCFCRCAHPISSHLRPSSLRSSSSLPAPCEPVPI